MDTDTLLVLIPVGAIGAFSFFLTFHRSYQDGLLGRFVLLVTFTVAVAMNLAYFRGHKSYNQFDIPTEIVVLLWAIAIFYTRFVMRFIYWWWTGKGGWVTRRPAAVDSRSHIDFDLKNLRARTDADLKEDRLRNDSDTKNFRDRTDEGIVANRAREDNETARERADADKRGARKAEDHAAKNGIH